MTFTTQNANRITWMNETDTDKQGIATMMRIKDAGKWDLFLSANMKEDGTVDCDALYDLLRYEPGNALQDVGLHENEGTATVAEVLHDWEEAHKAVGLKVSLCADGATPSGVSLYDYGPKKGGIVLEFESETPDGRIDAEELTEAEVLALCNHRANNNANAGKWTGHDDRNDVFEMWREE